MNANYYTELYTALDKIEEGSKAIRDMDLFPIGDLSEKDIQQIAADSADGVAHFKKYIEDVRNNHN